MATPGFVEVEVPGHGTVELPEGMSREDMAAAIHQLPQAKAGPPAGDQALGMAKQAGVGAAKTVISNAGLGGDLREAAGSAADWVASKFQKPKTLSELITGGTPSPASFNERFTGMPAPQPTAGDIVKRGLQSAPGLTGSFFSLPTSEDVRKGVEGYTGEFRKPQNVPEQYAETVGQFLPAVAAGPGGVAKETAAKTLAALLKEGVKRTATNAVLPGVASEAAGQAVHSTAPSAEPYVRFAASMAPAAVMSAGQAAWRGVRKPNIPPERQAAYERLSNDEGVTSMTPGEILGDTGRRYNEAGAGLRAQAQDQDKLRQLTAAAVRRFGENGENFHDALASGRARIGTEMGDAAGRLRVRMDPELGDALVGIDKATFKEGLNADAVTRLRAVRNHIVNTFETVARKSKAKNAAELPDWTEVKGPAFQNLISHDSVLQGAIDEPGRIGYYAKQMKNALLDAAERTANRQGTGQKNKVTGADTGDRKALADFLKSRREYANMMAMQEGASAAGENAANGLLTPAVLRQIATNRDKADYFLNRGDYAQLAKDANLMMTALPNSGTAQRLKSMLPWQLLGSIGGAVIGGTASPGLGHAVGATMGAAAGPALKARMVRLKPWWLDQEVANRRHLASLLQSEVAGRKLLEGPDQSQ